MILVVGGLASGKRDYVKKTFGYTDSEMADGILDSQPVIYNLQNLVTTSIDTINDLLPALMEKDVVICNEVGSGIVPFDKTERAAREATGRLCVLLAERAEKVIRIYCGIPTVIKG
jgi:adenosyl cobinamide kinase/adenosyl cobinamide phosphate guanylyltransferase